MDTFCSSSKLTVMLAQRHLLANITGSRNSIFFWTNKNVNTHLTYCHLIVRGQCIKKTLFLYWQTVASVHIQWTGSNIRTPSESCFVHMVNINPGFTLWIHYIHQLLSNVVCMKLVAGQSVYNRVCLSLFVETAAC